MVQNQDEMLKSGRLDRPYTGVLDCSKRIVREEGLLQFWRGNVANCLRCFPSSVLNLAFKPKIKAKIKVKREDGYFTKLGKEIAAGAFADLMSMYLV